MSDSSIQRGSSPIPSTNLGVATDGKTATGNGLLANIGGEPISAEASGSGTPVGNADAIAVFGDSPATVAPLTSGSSLVQGKSGGVPGLFVFGADATPYFQVTTDPNPALARMAITMAPAQQVGMSIDAGTNATSIPLTIGSDTLPGGVTVVGDPNQAALVTEISFPYLSGPIFLDTSLDLSSVAIGATGTLNNVPIGPNTTTASAGPFNIHPGSAGLTITGFELLNFAGNPPAAESFSPTFRLINRGAGTLTLTNQGAGSNPANRLSLPSAASLVIPINGMVHLYCDQDVDSPSWLVLSKNF